MKNFLHNKKGAAMEMAVFYIVIILLLGLLICMASLFSFNSVKSNEKVFEKTVDRKVELDQIGDIFMNGIVNREHENDIRADILAKINDPDAKLQLDCDIQMIGYSNHDYIMNSDSSFASLVARIENSMKSNDFTPWTKIGEGLKKVVDFVLGTHDTSGTINENDIKSYADKMSEMYNIYEMRITDKSGNLILDVAIKENYSADASTIDINNIQNLMLNVNYTVLNWSDQLITSQTVGNASEGEVDNTFDGQASVVAAEDEDTDFLTHCYKFIKYTSAAIAASPYL